MTVSLTYEPGRVAFAGRALDLRAASRRWPTSTARWRPAPSTTRRRRALRSPISSARCSRPAPRAWTPRTPCACSRAAASGPSSSSSRRTSTSCSAGHAGGGDRGRHALRRARARTCSKRCSPPPGIPFALERRRRLGDTAIGRALIGLLRCLPAPAGASGGRARRPARLAARAGPARAPRVRRLAGDHARGAPARVSAEQARHPVGGAPLAAGHDRPARAGRRARAGGADRAGDARARSGCSPRPGGRGASVLGEDELDEARAQSAGLGALAELRELARGRAGARAGRRAGARALARARRGVQRTAARLRARWRCSTPLALRARRVQGAVRVRPAGGRVPGARAAAAAAGRGGARAGSPKSPGCAWASTRTPPEASWRAERYLLYAAVSRPQELLVLSWHVADDDGDPTARSLFVDDVCDLFDEKLAAQRLRRPLGAVERRASRSAPAARRRARRRSRDERVLEALRERLWSASSLEGWIRCPMRWFVDEPARSRRLRSRARAARPRRSRPRRAEGHARGPARRDGLGARDAGASGPRARAAGGGARAQRARASAVRRTRAPAGRAQAAARRPRALPGARGRAREPARAQVPRGRLRDRRRRRQGRGERSAGIRVRSRRRGFAAGSTGSTSARPARRSSTTTRAAPRPRPRSGSRRASCRWPCTCARSRSCSACASRAASTSR